MLRVVYDKNLQNSEQASACMICIGTSGTIFLEARHAIIARIRHTTVGVIAYNIFRASKILQVNNALINK